MRVDGRHRQGCNILAFADASSEFSVAKKLRRTAECVLTMVLDNSNTLQDFPHPDPDTQVVCLSQTVRLAGDAEVGERPSVVVPSSMQPIPWHHYLLREKFTNMWIQSVLCCEAFKILEADFSELLRSYLGMEVYSETLEKLRAVINYSAKSLKYPMDTLLLASFGIFVVALVNLHDVEPANDAKKEELARRISLGKALFMEIVQERVSTLKERCEAELVGIDGQIEDACAFMCNEDNFEGTIHEWAAIVETWVTRNASSHPFSKLTSHEERRATINYFGSIIDGEHCQFF